MKRLLSLCLCLAVCLPSIASAETSVSRKDGFLLIWSGIKRPVLSTYAKPFPDLPKGAPGSDVITYAKGRGLIDEGDAFRPNDLLLLPDALLWLYRTRNVDDNDLLTIEALPSLTGKYPIVKLPRGATAVESRPVTLEELQQLAKKLDEMLVQEDHEVSLYSEKFHGKGTAFGETFDMHAMTAAHRTFPHNTLVKVTNIENGKSVTVRINDRGPFVKGRDMDLSLGSFITIAERSKGKIRARFERLGDVTLNGPCAQQPRHLQRLPGGVVLKPGIPNTIRAGGAVEFTPTKPVLIREVIAPDGTKTALDQAVAADGTFRYQPSGTGMYRFRISTGGNRSRLVATEVIACS